MKKIVAIFLIMTMVVLYGCNNKTTNDSNELLYRAIVSGNYEAAKEAVRKGADVDNLGEFSDKTAFSSHDSNPTAIALSCGQNKIAEFLIKNGSNSNYGYLSEHVLNYNDVSFLDFLIAQGADINYKNYAGEYNGETALERFLSTDDLQDCNVNGYIKMFEYLINQGADYKSLLSNFDLSSLSDYYIIKHIHDFMEKHNIKSAKNKTLDVIIAKDKQSFVNLLNDDYSDRFAFFTVAYGNLDMVKLLCETKDVNNLKDDSGNSLLFAATVNTDKTVAEYLLKKLHININMKNNDDYNVLSYALALGKTNYAKLYLVKGAKIQFADFSNKEDESDALIFAALNDKIESVNLLLKTGYPKGNKELLFNALQAVIDCDNVEMLRYFIKNKICSINIENDDENLLSYACFYDREKCAQYLIENKVIFKYYPLHNSIENHNLRLTKQLVKYSKNINEEDDELYSPLMKAVAVGDLDIIKLLIENGADINFKNKKGESAVSLAKNNLSQNVKKYITNQMK